jgi:nitroreductase
MNFLDLIEKRYSVRSYKPNDVDDTKLQQLLDAARLAPTASNRQPFKLIVIHTAGREMELRRIYDKDWFVQAPLIICICGTPNQAWIRRDQKNYCDVDVAIAMDHLILAATELGLGTCWIAAFDPVAARAVLGLPDEVEPIAFTPIGYPNDQPRPKRRKDLTELILYDRW